MDYYCWITIVWVKSIQRHCRIYMLFFCRHIFMKCNYNFGIVPNVWLFFRQNLIFAETQLKQNFGQSLVFILIHIYYLLFCLFYFMIFLVCLVSFFKNCRWQVFVAHNVCIWVFKNFRFWSRWLRLFWPILSNGRSHVWLYLKFIILKIDLFLYVVLFIYLFA